MNVVDVTLLVEKELISPFEAKILIRQMAEFAGLTWPDDDPRAGVLKALKG